MSNEFLDEKQEDAMEYAKHILSNSSSIKEIVKNIDIFQKELENEKSSQYMKIRR